MPACAGANSDYPDRPIQIDAPFAAGSASDVITRILLSRMATSLGQAFVVENRPGAGGNIGNRSRRARRAGRLYAGNEYFRAAGCKQSSV